MDRIGLGRETWLRTFIITLLFAWPLLVFGRPAYIADDSVAYQKGGQVAVAFVLGRLIQETDSDFRQGASEVEPSGQHDPLQGANASSKPVIGARSASYSAAAYLLRLPYDSMMALAIIQTFLVALVIVIFAACVGPIKTRNLVGFMLFLAIASPVAIVSNLIMPDIFAGIILLTIFSFLTGYRKLSLAAKICLFMVLGISSTFHASLPPLALATLLAAGLLWLWRRQGGSSLSIKAVGIAVAAVLSGLAMTAIAGGVAFGDASIAPKRFPLALARSVSDGPGRWYLEEECKKPRYAVCEVFGTDIPDTIAGFVFVGGLRERATPEQMDRIRGEESEIVINAAMRYPQVEAANLTRNIFRQIVLFQNVVTFFNLSVERGPDGDPILVGSLSERSGVFGILDGIAYVVTGLSLVLIGLRFPRMTHQQREILLLLVAAILANSVIVVVFSGVAPRYVARLIWIVPLVAFTFDYAIRRSAKVSSASDLTTTSSQ